MRPSPDPRFGKQTLLDADDAEFSTRMVEIDAELRAERLTILQRPLQAIRVLCKWGGFSLSLHEPLAVRVNSWFKTRYENRLKFDATLGYGPVVIRGDLYKMRTPMLFFGGQVVCIAGSVEPFGVVPIVNVLDEIEGLSQALASELRTSELKELQVQFTTRLRHFLEIGELPRDGLIGSALGDINSVADFVFQERPQHGQARWACLQAVEKCIKGWIEERGGSYKKVHDLAKLVDMADRLGPSGLSRGEVQAVQCQAGVRYGEFPVGSEELVTAFDACLSLCAKIASALRLGRVREAPPLPQPSPNRLTRERFLSLRVGDKLLSGDVRLTIMGVAQDRPRWYRALAEGAIAESLIVENDFQSFELAGYRQD